MSQGVAPAIRKSYRIQWTIANSVRTFRVYPKQKVTALINSKAPGIN